MGSPIMNETPGNPVDRDPPVARDPTGGTCCPEGTREDKTSSSGPG